MVVVGVICVGVWCVYVVPGVMGRICTSYVNNSQVAQAGGQHHIINVLAHSWHPTQGCIPAVMGSSWTGVSGRTADAGPLLRRRPLGTPPNLSQPQPAALSLPRV